jgi:uncharacterized protein YkwD
MVRQAAAVVLPVLAWPGGVGAEALPTERMLAAINDVRRERGLEPLVAEERPMRAAQAHARDMALNGFVGHRGSGGAGLEGRLAGAGHPYRRVAENFAAGTETPEVTVAGWMGSAGHRRNILSPGLREAGIGYGAAPGIDAATAGATFRRPCPARRARRMT